MNLNWPKSLVVSVIEMPGLSCLTSSRFSPMKKKYDDIGRFGMPSTLVFFFLVFGSLASPPDRLRSFSFFRFCCFSGDLTLPLSSWIHNLDSWNVLEIAESQNPDEDQNYTTFKAKSVHLPSHDLRNQSTGQPHQSRTLHHRQTWPRGQRLRGWSLRQLTTRPNRRTDCWDRLWFRQRSDRYCRPLKILKILK